MTQYAGCVTLTIGFRRGRWGSRHAGPPFGGDQPPAARRPGDAPWPGVEPGAPV